MQVTLTAKRRQERKEPQNRLIIPLRSSMVCARMPSGRRARTEECQFAMKKVNGDLQRISAGTATKNLSHPRLCQEYK